MARETIVFPITSAAIDRVAAVLMGSSHFELQQSDAVSLAEDLLRAAANPEHEPPRVQVSRVRSVETTAMFHADLLEKEP